MAIFGRALNPRSCNDPTPSFSICLRTIARGVAIFLWAISPAPSVSRVTSLPKRANACANSQPIGPGADDATRVAIQLK